MEATANEITRLRNVIWDPWNDYPPVEFTAEELEWLEGRYTPEVDEYLRRRVPDVVTAIERWAHDTPLRRLGDAVSYVALGRDRLRAAPIIEDVLLEGQVVILGGEEGAGKSTLSHEIAHGLHAGRVLGDFATARGIGRVLIVDVEQTEEDARIIRDDLAARGITLDEEVYWVDASGRSFDSEDDKTWLRQQVRAVEPDVIILDTATEAVTRPREDESVKQLFILFGSLFRNDGVRGAMFLGQARKRSQEADGPRQFDDLFGSRVWKGRSSAAFWIEGETFTVWKQRGSLLEKRWGGRDDGQKYATGRLIRTDGPTELRGPLSQEERRRRIMETVAAKPGEYSKTSLIEQHFHVTGDIDRQRWRRDVDELLRNEDLVQEGQYKRLSPHPAGGREIRARGEEPLPRSDTDAPTAPRGLYIAG